MRPQFLNMGPRLWPRVPVAQGRRYGWKATEFSDSRREIMATTPSEFGAARHAVQFVDNWLEVRTQVLHAVPHVRHRVRVTEGCRDNLDPAELPNSTAQVISPSFREFVITRHAAELSHDGVEVRA